MANKPPAVKITGIRGSIPSGYILGRVSAGIGDVELISQGKAQSAGLIPTSLPGPPTGAAGGDLSGTYPNPVVAQIQGRPVAATAPSNLAALLYHTAGATWLPVLLGAVAYTSAYSDLSGVPAIHNVIAGGTTGQVLTKNSNTDYDLTWATPAASSGGGAASIYDDGTNLYVALSDADGQLVLDGSDDPVFSKEVLPGLSMPVDGTTIKVAGGLLAQVLNTLPVFSADLNGSAQSASPGIQLVNLSHASVDTRGWFDTVNHRYKPQVAGKYVFIGYYQPNESGAPADDGAETLIYKNGVFAAGGTTAQSIGSGTGSLCFTILDMNGTTDYTDLRAYGTSTITAIRGLASQTYFAGFLLPSNFNS